MVKIFNYIDGIMYIGNVVTDDNNIFYLESALEILIQKPSGNITVPQGAGVTIGFKSIPFFDMNKQIQISKNCIALRSIYEPVKEISEMYNKQVEVIKTKMGHSKVSEATPEERKHLNV